MCCSDSEWCRLACSDRLGRSGERSCRGGMARSGGEETGGPKGGATRCSCSCCLGLRCSPGTHQEGHVAAPHSVEALQFSHSTTTCLLRVRGRRVGRHHKDGRYICGRHRRRGRELAAGRSRRLGLELEKGGVHQWRLCVVVAGNGVAVGGGLGHCIGVSGSGSQVVVVAVILCRAGRVKGRSGVTLWAEGGCRCSTGGWTAEGLAGWYVVWCVVLRRVWFGVMCAWCGGLGPRHVGRAWHVCRSQRSHPGCPAGAHPPPWQWPSPSACGCAWAGPRCRRQTVSGPGPASRPPGPTRGCPAQGARCQAHGRRCRGLCQELTPPEQAGRQLQLPLQRPLPPRLLRWPAAPYGPPPPPPRHVCARRSRGAQPAWCSARSACSAPRSAG